MGELVESLLVVREPVGGLNGVNMLLPGGGNMNVQLGLQSVVLSLCLQILGLGLAVILLDGALLVRHRFKDLLLLVFQILNGSDEGLVKLRLLQALSLELVQVRGQGSDIGSHTLLSIRL